MDMEREKLEKRIKAHTDDMETMEIGIHPLLNFTRWLYIKSVRLLALRTFA